MSIRNPLAVAALVSTLALGGAAMAASTTDKTQGGAAATGTMKDSATGTTGTGNAATTDTTTHWFSTMKASDLDGKDVRNQNNEEVGEIQKIVRDTDGDYHAVVSVGGFLGLGDKDVLIPLSRMTMADNDVILLSSEDEEQLKAMPAYDTKVTGYTEIKGDQMLGM